MGVITVDPDTLSVEPVLIQGHGPGLGDVVVERIVQGSDTIQEEQRFTWVICPDTARRPVEGAFSMLNDSSHNELAA